MHAIASLQIENFRCFEKLRVDGLTRVSLIVGANNSGKTALLEAFEAVASSESPFVLYRASLEHREFRRGRGDTVEIDLRHWLRGHGLEEGATFRINAAGARELRVAQRRLKVCHMVAGMAMLAVGFVGTAAVRCPSLLPVPI